MSKYSVVFREEEICELLNERIKEKYNGAIVNKKVIDSISIRSFDGDVFSIRDYNNKNYQLEISFEISKEEFNDI